MVTPGSTRHKKDGERLREGEELVKLLLNSTAEGIFGLDLKGNCIFCNRASLDLLGYEDEKELLGKSMHERIHHTRPDGSPFPIEECRVCRAFLDDQGFHVRDEIFWRPDGTSFNVEYRSFPMRKMGEVIGTVVTFLDTTELRRTEEDLKERNKFIETVLDNLPIGLAVFTFDERTLQYANKKYEEILGWPKEMLSDFRSRWEHIFPDPALRKELLGRFDAGWASGDLARMVWEFPITRASGERVEVLNADIPMFSNNLFIATFQDITVRKRAEDEVRRLNQELEARVVERTRELEFANRELEAFTYSVSHDIRAPLRAINGFSDALLEDYGDRLDEEGKRYLRFLQESSQEMSDLIDGLLKLSRSTRGELEREHVDLSSMAGGIVAQFRQSEPKRQVTVNIAPGMDLDADPRLLKVVMENLIGNAWKYTAKTKEASIEFYVVEQQEETIYAVRDNGAGFDMAYANKLFLPFHRLHKTGEFPGTGIGLATVQRIVHRHGGRIWAEAAVGEGATFFFTLEEKKNDDKPVDSTG